jgi:hypothetical protein
MSIQHMYIRAYGPAVSGRDRGIPELWTRADTLIRPAHKQGGQTLQQNLDVEQQQGQGQRQIKTRPTGAIDNVSIQSKNNNNNALPPFFLGGERVFTGVGGNGGGELPGGSPNSLSCWHPVYMLHDKTWRKPDRVIASLNYGKRRHQRNPAEVFHHLPNT